VTQRISTQVNDESFDFFQVQEMLSGGLALVAETCADSWSASETESLFLMNYGDGLYKLELPEQASNHISTNVCGIVVAENELPDSEVNELGFGQLAPPFGKGRVLESTCSFFYGDRAGRSTSLTIFEFQSDADQISFLEGTKSLGVTVGQVFRAGGVYIFYYGSPLLPDDLFDTLGFEAIVSR
jgi:hypothetical protein